MIRMELFNEALNMCILYHMVLMTKIIDSWPAVDNMVKFQLGNSLIYTIAIIFGVNISFAIV
jgi:hypothetical protein